MAPHRRSAASSLAVVLAVVGLAAGCATDAGGREASRSVPPLATVVAARPAPAPTPRLLLVGDGVAFDLAPALEAAARAGGATLWAAPVMGFGLTTPEVHDWRVRWPELLATHRPQAVVVQVGPWDARPVDIGGTTLAPGRPGWHEWYRATVVDAVDLLAAGGARIVWVGMIAPGEARRDADVAAFNAAVRDALGARPDAVFVDVQRALAGPSGDRLLKPDLVHLCPAGAARVAGAVVVAAGMRPTDDRWADGPWRGDERYRWAHGGGCPAS